MTSLQLIVFLLKRTNRLENLLFTGLGSPSFSGGVRSSKTPAFQVNELGLHTRRRPQRISLLVKSWGWNSCIPAS